jgi:hypothetical protein
MKLVYWLVPFLGVSAFAAYYHYGARQQGWNECKTPAELIERARIADQEARDRAQKMRRALVGDYEGRDGQQEARDDLARNTPKLLGYGLPVHWIGEFGEVLQRDYGVSREAIAGCVVSESLIQYAHAYNAVIEEHLKAKHGPDVMEVAVKKAEALYAERRISHEAARKQKNP